MIDKNISEKELYNMIVSNTNDYMITKLYYRHCIMQSLRSYDINATDEEIDMLISMLEDSYLDIDDIQITRLADILVENKNDALYDDEWDIKDYLYD